MSITKQIISVSIGIAVTVLFAGIIFIAGANMTIVNIFLSFVIPTVLFIIYKTTKSDIFRFMFIGALGYTIFTDLYSLLILYSNKYQL